MWHKLQYKILLDHPYFEFNSNSLLSLKEASKIYNAGFPSFSEMVDGAKERFGLPPKAWSGFDDVIESREYGTRRVVESGLIRRHKRLAVVFITIVLIISFFTLTPVGRALASDFFNMIMRAVEGRIVITSDNPNYLKLEFGEPPNEQYFKDNKGGTDSPVEYNWVFYNNIDEFVSKTGLTPVTFSTDLLRCESIKSLHDEITGLMLTIFYRTSDGLLVSTTQRWYCESGSSIEVKGATYSKTKIFGNIEMLYMTDPIDGSFSGIAVLDDSLLLIGAKKGVDINMLLDILN